MMSKFISLIICAVLVSAAFAAGRWAAPSALPTGATNNSFHLGASLMGASCNTPALPPVVVKTPSPFEGKTSDELAKKFAENKKRIPSAATQDEHQHLLEALAAIDPQAAMAQAQQLKGDRQAQAVSAVLAVWGEKDPQGAWGWVESTHPENIYQFDQLLEVFGRNDPETAARYATSLASSHPELTQEVYLSALMGITHAGGYDTARQMVETANISAEDRASLMNYVAGAWAAYEPQAAMQWVMSQPSELQSSALVGLGESWSSVDPQAAANFASKLNGPQRQLLLQQSISKWLMEDPNAASNWLSAAENHQDYDQAVHTLATLPNLVRDNSQTALSWSERIYDGNLRVSAVQQILAEMKIKDPTGAASYARSAPNLSPAQRTQLLNSLGDAK
jgi:hypothetical protein